MNHSFFKRIRRCKTVFAILIGLDVIVIIIFSILRFIDTLWGNQELWVNDTNEKVVISQVEEWHLPTEGITRVVMIPGLGDVSYKVYYKDGSMKTTGVLRSGDVSNEMSQLVGAYGEDEGSRRANTIYLVLGAVFFIALLSEVITYKIEEHVDNSLMETDAKMKWQNERRQRI